MSTHHLKTWPEYFAAVATGEKTFEIRLNDRNFQPGDTLILEEYDPQTKAYTGDAVTRRVWYVMPGGNFGIASEMVVMSLFPPGITDKFLETLHQLADMAERLNKLMMGLYPQAWGKDLVRATEEYINKQKDELKREQWKVIRLMAAGDRLLDHVVTQHHPDDVRDWKDAKEL